MSEAKDLIVAYNFPPFVDASAITQAKRIAARGSYVDVVSQDLSGFRSRDDSLLALVSPWIKRHEVVSGRPAFLNWASMRRFTKSGYRRLAVRGPMTRYRSVYSRSMWPHSHVLAALIKVMHPSIHWAAEFSDPLLQHTNGSLRRSPQLSWDDVLLRQLALSIPKPYRNIVDEGGQILHFIQGLCFGLADSLVFTNQQQQTVMLGDVGSDVVEDAGRRSIILPHPEPPATWMPQPLAADDPRDKCRIGYFGTLYPNRGLGSIAEAVRTLPRGMSEKLQIDIYTAQRESSYEQVKRCGVTDVMRIRDELGYLDFLRAASAYDHLLVTDTKTAGFQVPNPFLPSKVSDYAATGVNIMAFTAPASELSLRDYHPSAIVDDVSSIRRALIDAVEGLGRLSKSVGVRGPH